MINILIDRSVPDDKVADIRAALQNDIPNEQVPGDDPYFGGKKMALFARLSLIADEIGESGEHLPLIG